jgi:hypothetical protein
MLGFLHSAQVHVETFDVLSRAADASVPLCHVVRADLFARVLADGEVTDDVITAVHAAIQALVDRGARVVVCTCSTLGSWAEAAPIAGGAQVLRVDRPLAERVVATGRRILVVAATAAAMQAALDLLRSVARQQQREPEIAQLSGASAWDHFLAGDHAAYALQIAELVEAQARPGDHVMLAQASMAPALLAIRRQDIDVSASPAVGVRAALAIYRDLDSPSD